MGEGKKRASFSGKVGFVLAAASSAVGLGNMQVPYAAAKYGGGTFLLIYLILAVTFGFSVMITEIAIGRKTGLSAIGAFGALNQKFAFCGILGAIIPIIITPYYSVIGGWVTKYIAVYITGQGHAAAQGNYFSGYITETVQPIVWFVVFIILTAVVVALGVEKGIEKASVIMMPILIVLSLLIALYSITRPGAGVQELPIISNRIFTRSQGRRFWQHLDSFLFHVTCNGNYDHIWFLYEKNG